MFNYLTASQLAKLAGTTKRTILWYGQLGIIKPQKVSSEGYRYYFESQVLEYQMILLLTTLGVTLKEIKIHLGSQGNLKSLFELKKSAIKKEIDRLSFSLTSLNKFMANIDQTQTMVNPEIKVLKPFEIFYIERVGAYVDIDQFCSQLSSMFSVKGKSFTTLAIFKDSTYQPKKSPIIIGALKTLGMVVNPRFKSEIKTMHFAPGKVITYTHNGRGELLSLFWKELEKYCRLNHLEVNSTVPDFEIYRQVSPDPRRQFFEIYVPIK